MTTGILPTCSRLFCTRDECCSRRNFMKLSVNRGIAMLTGLTAITLLAGTPNSHSEATSVVKVDGSSTVFPITEAVAEEFQKETRGAIRVTVGISGTGGGFKKFCRGETDVQDASRPISASEMETCRASGIQYYELPVAFDALTIAVSPLATWL